jgi:formamidopyrimidine-DNA glycosylase
LGQEGNYQNHALVYGREGEKCKLCPGKIQKIKLGGRGTYFCPECQK